MNNYGDLLKEFFVTDFKLRYKHSYLGFLWVILKPLSYYAVLYIVWTALMGNTPNYASYLLIGVLSLSYFNEGIQFGLQSLFNKAHIILKVNFPREVVVFSSVAIATTNFLINFMIYVAFRLFSRQQLFTDHWYLFILGVFLETIFLLGVSFFTSVISIKLQDIKHFVELVLQLMFWATPIFYSLEQMPPSIAAILTFVNPLVTILGLMRAGLLSTAVTPATLPIAIFSMMICAFTTCGFLFFRRALPKIAEYF